MEAMADSNEAAGGEADAEPALSTRELLQTMVDACYYVGSGCPICRDLARKIDSMNNQQPLDSSTLIELENSRLVRQQFAMCTQTFAVANRAGSMASSDPQLDTPEGNFGVVNAGRRQLADATGIFDDSRESHRSDLLDALGKNVTLSYGLHHLIKDVEQRGSNHCRQVFRGLDQEQLRSLLAQITCDEIQWMQTESDPRLQKLLRIEQELADLMTKEEASRMTLPDRHSSVGGMTSTSKKSSHDNQGY